MKRRYLFCFLLVGLLCVLVPQLALGSFAAEPLSGACGDAILWSLDPDTGTLTVSGTGDMWDYSFSDYPFKDYRKDIRSVVISEGITHIGDHAFYNLSLKAPLSIPSSVKTIGSYAFASLVGVQSITIPYGVTSIGERAFECGYMTSISVPESVTFLGEGVFEDCLYLTSVNIPSGITELSPCLFQNCVHLQTVTLPSKLKTIGEFAFKGCKKLYDLNFPETLTDISLGAFAYCSLFSCVLPDTVRIIGADAFLHAFDYDYAFYMEEPYFIPVSI